MKKRFIALMLLLVLAALPVFAEKLEVPSVELSGKFVADGKLSFGRLSLEASDATYFDGDAAQTPFVKVNAGLSMVFTTDNKAQFGLSGLVEGGYSFKINSLLRADVGLGADLYESSAIVYAFKALSKEKDYKFTLGISPVVDASVLFGLDEISVRAGVRGGWQLGSKTMATGLNFVPYVGISSTILDFLAIF